MFREESFGPVLPVTTFADDDEALRLANDTDLGLQAAVFTSSLKRAFRFVHGLRAGQHRRERHDGLLGAASAVRRREPAPAPAGDASAGSTRCST